jgi:MoxR-like ATPase
MNEQNKTDWKLFTGSRRPHKAHKVELPDAPPWRNFKGEVPKERRLPTDDRQLSELLRERGTTFQAGPDGSGRSELIEMVNAALYLRRPLLITGEPGSGKSSLIYAVAYELRLGEVLRWPITSRSTLQQGLYQYDAIGRLQETQLSRNRQAPDISKYLRLGPLGTALLPTRRPRALLIDEIDKSDLDLPNDLLNIFEEGEFRIPELERLDQETVEIRDDSGQETFPITRGHVRCREFPFVILTSNGEREFPPPFLRRCLRLKMSKPDDKLLAQIVRAHLREKADDAQEVIKQFAARAASESLATDQLLNAVFLVEGRSGMSEDERKSLRAALLKELTTDRPE